jgi:hypothetical protein
MTILWTYLNGQNMPVYRAIKNKNDKTKLEQTQPIASKTLATLRANK